MSSTSCTAATFCAVPATWLCQAIRLIGANTVLQLEPALCSSLAYRATHWRCLDMGRGRADEQGTRVPGPGHGPCGGRGGSAGTTRNGGATRICIRHTMVCATLMSHAMAAPTTASLHAVLASALRLPCLSVEHAGCCAAAPPLAYVNSLTAVICNAARLTSGQLPVACSTPSARCQSGCPPVLPAGPSQGKCS